VHVSKTIKKYYEKKKKDTTSVVFTDLGLAPGWVNILAEEGLEKVCRDHSNDCLDDFVINKIDQITMMAGGIPITWSIDYLLNYNINWSIDGLINEYTDDVIIIDRGKKKTIKALDNVKQESVAGYYLQSFPTSGGLAHTENIIVNQPSINCEYRTLRWPEHYHIIKKLLKLGPELFKQILEKYKNIQKRNMVIAQTTVSSKELTWKKTINVIDDAILTSMQKCTAFPAAAVADYIVNHDSVWCKRNNKGLYMSYSDIGIHTFNNNLQRLFNGNRYYV
jgi:saccharopine dehydrogenase-like NADP-dependent oxidoreductase